MNQTKTMFVSMIMLALALSACGPSMATPEATDVATQLPEDVEMAVKEALSARIGGSVDEIDVVRARQVEWPDACLGLAEEGEACAEVITPGWEVTLRANGQEYVFHTNEEGSAVRMEE